ncbi:hypothetical protein G7Y79_00020g048390 [Physcia stellaris]|nr:hypothetical protein G7Y79_00020g048390 [Physcia stellaris]
MAGHNHGALSMDPALVKYNNMSANRWKYFRWTPRTAWISTVYVVIVPAAFAYVGFVTDMEEEERDGYADGVGFHQGKYDMRGKRRGDTISEW